MGCLASCLKLFIIGLNFILLFGCIVILVLGILFHTGSDVSFIKSLEDGTKTDIRNLMMNTGIGDVDNIDRFSVTDLLGGWIAHIMIGVGLGLSTLAFSGCCGAWYKIRCLLLIYILLLGIMMFVEALVFALAFTVPVTIQGQIKKELEESLSKFTGLAGDNAATLGWLFVMNYFKCCGIEGYTDFQDHSTSWDRTPGSTITSNIDAPLICCKTLPTSNTDSAVDCARGGSTLDINNQGCFDLIWDKILKNSLPTYLIIGNLFLIQLLVFIASIKFFREAKKKEKIHPQDPIPLKSILKKSRK